MGGARRLFGEVEAQGGYPSASKRDYLGNGESQVSMQFQCVHAGLGTVADIARLHPREELICKPVSPEVGKLRSGDLQVHIVAPDGIIILI